MKIGCAIFFRYFKIQVVPMNLNLPYPFMLVKNRYNVRALLTSENNSTASKWEYAVACAVTKLYVAGDKQR